MKKRLFLTLMFAATTCAAANNPPWFEQQTELTHAHKKLLENDLPGSFSAMVQVWQKSPEEYVARHLDLLLVKSLEKDCGRSLSKTELPEWLDELVIRRQVIQSPGRQSSSLIIDALAKQKIQNIRFRKWTKAKVSSDNDFNLLAEQPNGDLVYSKRYSLNSRLPSGLYQVTVSPVEGEEWNSWVIVSEPQAKEVLRWQSKDAWKVEKTGLLNRHCPLPVMNISVFDYFEGQYQKVWTKDYETEYPTTIPLSDFAPDRYVLAVSITHKRWQGVISIEDQQVISKTYDISVD